MLDEVQLQFDPASLTLLNIVLGLIMFGVALDLRVADFKRVLQEPRGAIVGLTGQLLILPALTFGLVVLIQPQASVALGMFLVAACPGGNMSNFISHLARGNTGLSISMTAVVTVLATLVTPLNFTVWASFYEPSRTMLEEVYLDPVGMFLIIGMLLILPVSLGMFVRRRWDAIADKISKYFRYGSVVALFAFIVIALGNNWGPFIDHIGAIFFIVMLHNAAALTVGWLTGWAGRLDHASRRAVTIEVGIQNSGLALILIFNFFDGLGGMALIAAWWGVWHLVAGLTLAGVWSRKPPKTGPEPIG